jgi:hypothetical protein
MASGNGRMSAAWAWDEALCRVVPPLISPLNATGELDPDAVTALVEHVLDAGCTGLFVLGGCGEGVPQYTHATLGYATVDALATNPQVLGIGNGLPAPPLAALGAEGRARVAAIVRRHAAALAR